MDSQDDKIKTLANNIQYATFMQRVHAYTLDCIIFAPLSAISGWNLIQWKNPWIAIGVIIIWCIYKPVLEWTQGATIGKKIIGLKVVDYNYEGISFNQAMLRFSVYFAVSIGNLLTFLTLYEHPDFSEALLPEDIIQIQQQNPDMTGSIIMFFFLFSVTRILFDQKRQAHHDAISHTYCIAVPKKSTSKKRR
jgi:uncharacterized RDD family membrane protein YckC